MREKATGTEAPSRARGPPYDRAVPVRALQISNYRSLRDLRLPLAGVTVLLGANGSGKSNVYRALQLLHAAAAGRLAETMVAEGGMPSLLWAGERKRRDEIREVRLTIGAEIDRFVFTLACGLPAPGAIFPLDPEVKEEDLGVRVVGRKTPVPLCERRGRAVSLRDPEGGRRTLADPFEVDESILSQVADPQRYPELALARQTLLGWRFYHQFRTDPESPLRLPRLGVRSPVLSHDGSNLASALLTIDAMRADDVLRDAIAAAFPGCELTIDRDERHALSVAWRRAGIRRALSAREMSDGTMRYLCLAAALLTPRPPLLLVLNEPETSLHHDLLAPLAALITGAAERCQLLVTTHARAFAESIVGATGGSLVELEMVDGQTRVR
jgi:predicted ATPase